MGGKGQLVPELRRRIDALPGFRAYHEPFVGGGALFFELRRSGRLDGGPVRLSDGNANLVEAWRAVRDDVDALVARLRGHRADHCEAYYYAVRAAVPADPVDRAARLVYLNKTGFNGLYRENSRGDFNVPFGRYRNPAICDEANLRACSAALQGVRVETEDFRAVEEHARPGDLVYFDPPYVPVSATASFTAYRRGGFGPGDQRDLAELCARLAAAGVHVLLSNSMTPEVRALYRGRPGLTVEAVLATRAVNSRADRRGKVEEALVRSF